MRIAVCPGSFDPVTNGHIDIFNRSSLIFDKLIVAVFHNPNKKPLFTMEERVEMLRVSTAHIPNVTVDCFSGLVYEYVRRQNSTIIVRGLRALSDFEYEFQRALLIKKLDPKMETVFMMTTAEYSYVSSSGVKELARFGGNIAELVPKAVSAKVLERLNQD